MQVRTYLMPCGVETVAGKVTQTTCMVAVGESGSIVAQEDNGSAVAVADELVLEVVGACRFECWVTDSVNFQTHRRLGRSGHKVQGWIVPCQYMLEVSYLEVTAVGAAVREFVYS